MIIRIDVISSENISISILTYLHLHNIEPSQYINKTPHLSNMKTPCIIASLAAAVSAVDIRLWVSSRACQDSGAAAVCTGWNPNVHIPSPSSSTVPFDSTNPFRQTCCGVPSGSFPSVGFYAIPREWYLEYRGHEGGDCRNTKTIEAKLDLTFKCLTNGAYTGAGYGFRSKRRDTGQNLVCGGEDAKECNGYQRPDLFETADGKKLSLVGLSDEQMLELFEQGANGSISKRYEALEIKA